MFIVVVVVVVVDWMKILQHSYWQTHSFVRENRVDAGMVSMVSKWIINRVTAVASGGSSRYLLSLFTLAASTAKRCVKRTYKPMYAAVEIKKKSVLYDVLFPTCAP